MLRIDGHTDKRPIKTARFPSNWELSTARAIAIVKHLVVSGIQANRLAANGFGEFRPLDPADTPAAYTINRSSVLVGFVDMMEILSGVLLGSFLGIVAEHVRRRRLAHRAAFRSSSQVSNTRSLPKTCSVGPTSTHVKPACS